MRGEPMNYRKTKSNYRKTWAVLALILALIGTPAGAAEKKLQPVEIYEATVFAIKDGDTIEVLVKSDLVGRMIRPLRLTDGADCPETSQPFGREAAERTAQLTAQGVLVEMTGRKSYNRHLARIWLPDGRSLAAVLVAEGLAMVDPRYAQKGGYLVKLQAMAKEQQKGLWTQPAPTTPWDHRKQR